MKESNPLVGIVMGSDSDLPVMRQAGQILEKFGIPFEMRILSAHRTPQETIEFSASASERGIETIIAGAGGAAHLPGVIAALTHLPVLGVPIQTAALSGLDSLLSIVQMPSGIPVATVAINGAKNAGILAAQILGVKHPEIAQKVKAFKQELGSAVRKKDQDLLKMGYSSYLKKMGK